MWMVLFTCLLGTSCSHGATQSGGPYPTEQACTVAAQTFLTNFKLADQYKFECTKQS